jgi:hypothetical protein
MITNQKVYLHDGGILQPHQLRQYNDLKFSRENDEKQNG